MFIRRFIFARVIKLPVGTWWRCWISRRLDLRNIFWLFGSDFGSGTDNEIGKAARTFGPHLPFILVASHDVTQREEHTRKQQHEKKEANNVPAFQHALTGAPFSP